MVIIGMVFEFYDLSEHHFFAFFSLTNPYIAMAMLTDSAFGAGMGIASSFKWITHCITMLTASAVLISVSVAFVRKVALRQATGQPDIFTPKQKSAPGDAQTNCHPKIRPVSSSPVIWKELYGSVFGKHKFMISIFLAIVSIILIITYIALAVEQELDEDEVHICYVLIFYSIGLLFTLIIPSTSITQEKESRSWHLLLATTLSDTEIAVGKFIGSVKRILPAWGFLFAHMILFTVTGFIHPIAILQMIIITTGTCFFIIGSGLFFSTIFKRTTTAVIVNIIFIAVIWAGIPLLIAIIGEIVNFHEMEAFAEDYLCIVPFAQALISIERLVDYAPGYSFRYLHRGMSPWTATIYMMIFNSIHMAMGITFTWMAKKRFRKKIF